MNEFLRSDSIVDWHHPDVTAQARALRGQQTTAAEIARRCFEWVRDEIKHSHDYGLRPVTYIASDVLRVRSGYCYAKSHLLAALLRANDIPAALCYQRLSRDDSGPPFCLHGLNAVWLPATGWYRIDPRGNRVDVNAQFVPPHEQLAFAIKTAGELDLPGFHVEPLPVVIDVLRSYSDASELWEHLPDLDSGA